MTDKPLSRLSEFLKVLADTETMDSLAAETLSIIAHYSLTAIASGLIAGSKAATPQRFHFVRWTAPWLERYIEEDLQPLDPIPRWARGSGTPASFGLIFSRLKPKDPGHVVVQRAMEFGYTEGICVPMRAADAAIGLVSMAGNRGPFNAEEFRELVAISNVIFHSGERINRSDETAQGSPILTLREIELLSFLVHGHPDREIARMNGITEATVRFHLKNARLKVGASSRTHLAAKVVAMGFVSL